MMYMKKHLKLGGIPTLVFLAAVFSLPVYVLPAPVLSQTYTTVSSSTTVSNPYCAAFTHSLYVGSRDSFTLGQVSLLQRFLTSQGIYSGPVTGYYGYMTASAVARFQRDHGISPVGAVGPLTRAAINAIACGGNPPPVYGAPSVTSLNPSYGQVGSLVTVYGSRFTADNTIHFNGGVVPHAYSGNGTSLTFIVPEALDPACYFTVPRCMTFAASQRVIPGNYNVSVENSYGTSNTITYTVTGGSQTNAPIITSITPSFGPIGTTFTITGSGFTSDNNVKFDIGAATHVAASNNGTTLTYTVPSYLGYSCSYSQPNCAVIAIAKQVTPGNYNVSVENANGLSNASVFTVTGGSTSNAPQISSINPTSGPMGSQVTLTGSGFTSNSLVYFGSGATNAVNVTSDGNTLSFTVPTYLNPSCYYSNPQCLVYGPAQQITPGTYNIYVSNGVGTSNTVNFTVTGGTTNNQTPTITSVNGPTNLSVGQTGTWSITARDYSYGNLTYSVTWGDEIYYPYMTAGASPAYYSSSQTSTFNHAYSRPGNYTVTFKVTNNIGVSAQSTMTVSVY